MHISAWVLVGLKSKDHITALALSEQSRTARAELVNSCVVDVVDGGMQANTKTARNSARAGAFYSLVNISLPWSIPAWRISQAYAALGEQQIQLVLLQF